jgi:hypothetical protein
MEEAVMLAMTAAAGVARPVAGVAMPAASLKAAAQTLATLTPAARCRASQSQMCPRHWMDRG